jgi:hypothetical protein
MASLKIRIFKDGRSEPKKTVTIPIAVLKFASKLMPRHAAAALEEKGIDLGELVRLSENDEVRGTVVEIEEHEKNEKVIIALE